MSADSRGKWPKGRDATVLKKLLGSLELEVMEHMWQAGESTVQQVAKAINRQRAIAYTTVMTVMGHLVDKELLSRTLEGKRYRYRVSLSKDEFLREASRRMVRALVDDFGDMAFAGFLGEINKVDAERLEQLKNLVQESGGEDNVSK
jgi:BlaI family penicillinase repressor